MAIDPLLLNTKDASEMEIGIPTAEGFFFYYEGNKLMIASMTELYDRLDSAYIGVVSPSSTPPADGAWWAVAGAAGTYANWSGIVVTAAEMDIDPVTGVANNRVILEVNNGVATKRIERVKGDDGAAGSVPTVQKKGQSTTDVMSQKAVTDEVSRIDALSYIDSKVPPTRELSGFSTFMDATYYSEDDNWFDNVERPLHGVSILSGNVGTLSVGLFTISGTTATVFSEKTLNVIAGVNTFTASEITDLAPVSGTKYFIFVKKVTGNTAYTKADNTGKGRHIATATPTVLSTNNFSSSFYLSIRKRKGDVTEYDATKGYSGGRTFTYKDELYKVLENQTLLIGEIPDNSGKVVKIAKNYDSILFDKTQVPTGRDLTTFTANPIDTTYYGEHDNWFDGVDRPLESISLWSLGSGSVSIGLFTVSGTAATVFSEKTLNVVAGLNIFKRAEIITSEPINGVKYYVFVKKVTGNTVGIKPSFHTALGRYINGSNVVINNNNAYGFFLNITKAKAVGAGGQGWSPKIEPDTSVAGKVLLKLTDWIGGSGTKPTSYVNQWMKNGGGYTSVISEAVNIKGADGSSGANGSGTTSETSSQYKTVKTLSAGVPLTISGKDFEPTLNRTPISVQVLVGGQAKDVTMSYFWNSTDTAVADVVLTSVVDLFDAEIYIIGGELNYPEMLKDGKTKAIYRPKDDLFVTRDTNGKDVIYWDVIVGKNARSAEMSSGTLEPYAVYEITATEANYFGSGLVVGNIFVASAATALGATNKVKRCLGNHLTQPTAAKRPIRGLFDGTDDIMKTAAFSLPQPLTIYSALSIENWVQNKILWDGGTVNSVALHQRGIIEGSPDQIRAYGGAYSEFIVTPGNDKKFIIRQKMDGASSKLEINGSSTNGNYGTNGLTGFTLGAVNSGANGADFSNIEVSEIILRGEVDNGSNDKEIYNFLNNKHIIKDSDQVFDNGKFVITSDDGRLTNYTHMLPILLDEGVKATFYLVPTWLAPGTNTSYAFMTAAQALEMHTAGMDMQCHTWDHLPLSTKSQATIYNEFLQVNDAFASYGLPIPEHCAYPFGNHDNKVILAEQQNMVRKTGRTTLEGFVKKNTDRYKIPSFVADTMDETKFTYLKAKMDYAQANKLGMTIFVHGLSADAGNITEAYLRAFITYARTIGMDIITYKELAKLLNHPYN